MLIQRTKPEFEVYAEPPPDGVTDLYLVRVTSDGDARFVKMSLSGTEMARVREPDSWLRYFAPAVAALQQRP
jgi:hypothetical protein